MSTVCTDGAQRSAAIFPMHPKVGCISKNKCNLLNETSQSHYFYRIYHCPAPPPRYEWVYLPLFKVSDTPLAFYHTSSRLRFSLAKCFNLSF